MKYLSVFILASTLVCSNAFATYYSCHSAYFVTAHYSGVAYGKEVQSVVAHIGVRQLEQDLRSNVDRYYWQPNAISDVEMQRVGDHFFAKALTTGERGGGDGAVTTLNLGPVIQYFVTFTDGSQITAPSENSIFIRQTLGRNDTDLQEVALKEYIAAKDAEHTSAVETHSGSGCSN